MISDKPSDYYAAKPDDWWDYVHSTTDYFIYFLMFGFCPVKSELFPEEDAVAYHNALWQLGLEEDPCL